MGLAGSRVSSFLYARRVVPARTGLTCQQSPAPATRVSRGSNRIGHATNRAFHCFHRTHRYMCNYTYPHLPPRYIILHRDTTFDLSAAQSEVNCITGSQGLGSSAQGSVRGHRQQLCDRTAFYVYSVQS